MEWISVKDRLPKDQYVLMFSQHKDGSKYMDYGYYNEGFFVTCFEQTHVTHWMPSPKPPKD